MGRCDLSHLRQAIVMTSLAIQQRYDVIKDSYDVVNQSFIDDVFNLFNVSCDKILNMSDVMELLGYANSFRSQNSRAPIGLTKTSMANSIFKALCMKNGKIYDHDCGMSGLRNLPFSTNVTHIREENIQHDNVDTYSVMFRPPEKGYGWTNHKGHRENILSPYIGGMGGFMCDNYWAMDLDGDFGVNTVASSRSYAMETMSRRCHVMVLFYAIMLWCLSRW